MDPDALQSPTAIITVKVFRTGDPEVVYLVVESEGPANLDDDGVKAILAQAASEIHR